MVTLRGRPAGDDGSATSGTSGQDDELDAHGTSGHQTRSTALEDPWAWPPYPDRVALAKSILGHARPADEPTRLAIAHALRALDGASIEQLQAEDA